MAVVRLIQLPELAGDASYEAQIDSWVAKAASRHHASFSSLVSSLPGIYPGFVAASLWRQGIALPLGASEKLLRLEGPVPHPKDGDWRFHPESLKLIAELLAKRPPERLAVLACPSLVRPLMPVASQICLADSNRAWARWLPADGIDLSWGDVSLAVRRWPQRFDAAIMDPPWYPLEFARFMSVAAALLKKDALLYVSFPSEGTRPGMAAERTQLLHTAKRLGLVHLSTRRGALRYATPFYEGCALFAGALPVLSGWRRSDLVTFRRVSFDYTEQMEPEDDAWRSAACGRLDLRIRPAEDSPGPCDPRLVSLVAGDVLASVSQRDPRRRAAMVWTSGNRIFGCSSADTFFELAAATMHARSPRESIEKRLGRPLADAEVQNIIETQAQLSQLEALEAQTYDEMHEDPVWRRDSDQARAEGSGTARTGVA